MADADAPKLIIDTDWKSQAQAEKEKLTQASAKPAAPRPGAGTGPAGAGAPGNGAEAQAADSNAPIGFQDLLSLLVSQALAYMGAYPDPRTGKAVVALEPARVYIDMLGVLQEKTKGNLSEAESQLLTRTLAELRMEFVEISKVVAKAIQEGKITPGVSATGGASGGPAGGGAGAGPLNLKF